MRLKLALLPNVARKRRKDNLVREALNVQQCTYVPEVYH